jgi:hypothetical protein
MTQSFKCKAKDGLEYGADGSRLFGDLWKLVEETVFQSCKIQGFTFLKVLN